MQIIFTDLDGTLLDDRKHISRENREAIREAVESGKKVVLTTGRALESLRQLLKELELDFPGCYGIAFNGGMIYECAGDRILYQRGLALDTVKYLFREADAWGIHIHTFWGERTVVRKRSDITDRYDVHNRIHSVIAQDIFSLVKEDPAKVLMADLHHTGILERFQEAHAEILKGKADSVKSCPEYLEYLPVGLNKGFAVRWLCDYLQIPVEESVAAGDAENDLPMILAAGVGAVMCNGDEAVKAQADYVTKADCNHSGFAEIVHTFLLDT